ncbi:hypothetical protein GPECTOR_38g326 [Gonium pectorale]|uniref:RCC1-like domain-containing protein n=1 Tax=Gonium pectorale TaxID=33097 RepID=A0A150GB85_GONPE|nr:hypothetical protein GPECTOR_38g326 [Gonium pectorale]|eukprot:KXZ47089.1 hypothetical protein GPECTOR_38g326 [Gonium pectorale]
MDTLVEVVKFGSSVHVAAAVQKLAGQINKTPLHRALYLGHLAAAAKLLQAGAALEAPDHKERTPVDLVSAELQRMPVAGTGRCSCIYSWGSGANYQLGTGSTDFHLTPLRVEALQGHNVVALVAAKFHSAALTADGRLLTWGWGRGGRLGHPDYNIHSGEAALIQPWQVAGLGRRQVVSVAAAKHHMLVATSTGDLWTWGGNRDGKLGYPNVDTQPTPRKVDFRGRAVLVGASNRHSACVTSAGEVWTWGANNDGQLGYGTNNSANNPAPRLVEAMKGKPLVALSLSKRHTVVLTADGDAYTWGHRVVTPRRVPLAGSRDTARLAATAGQVAAASAAGGAGPQASATAAGAATAGAAGEVRFHRNHAEVVRPEAVLAAAGFVHTTVVTRTGAVLCWRSADPALRPTEVAGPLAGKRVVAVAASKTRTVVCTDAGQVYMWEAKEAKERSGGTARSGQEAAGAATGQAAAAGAGGGAAAVGAGTPTVTAAAAAGGSGTVLAGPTAGAAAAEEAPEIVPARVPGLTRVAAVAVLCQRAVATQLVEPRTALPLLEYADVAGAALLRCYCMAVAVANLDCALLEAPAGLTGLPPHLLAELEHLYRAALLLPPPQAAVPGSAAGSLRGSSAGGVGGGGADALEAFHRRRVIVSRLQKGRRPTAPPKWLEGAAAAERMAPHASSRVAAAASAALGAIGHAALPGLQPLAVPALGVTMGHGSGGGEEGAAGMGPDEEVARLARNLQRKLQQIADLDAAQRGGRQLDSQQLAKLSQRGALQEALQALAAGASVEAVRQAIAHSAEVVSKLAARPDAAAVTAAAPSGSGGAGSSARAAAGGAGGAPQQARTTGAGATAAAPAALAPAGPSCSAGGSASASVAVPPTGGKSPVLPEKTPTAGTPGGGAAAAAAKKQQQQRRGGLSMFLAGALDQPIIPVPPTPPSTASPAAAKGPAWGGLTPQAAAAGAEGLRVLLSQLNPPSAAPVQASAAAQAQQLLPPVAASSASVPSRAPSGNLSAAAALPSRSPSGPLPLPLAQSGAAAFGGFPIAAAAGPGPSSAATARKPGQAAPATGGARPVAGVAASPIVSQQAASGSIAAAAGGGGSGVGGGGGGGGAGGGATSVKLSLAEFMSGRPVAAPLQAQKAREADREPAAPAWGGVLGSSPPSAKSLLDIQAEQAQVQKRAAANWAKTPAPGGAQASSSVLINAAATGADAAAAVPLGASPPGGSRSLLSGLSPAPPTQQPSKWFIPEECHPSVAARPLSAIQLEERAIKELESARHEARAAAHAPSRMQARLRVGPQALQAPHRAGSGEAGGGAGAAVRARA